MRVLHAGHGDELHRAPGARAEAGSRGDPRRGRGQPVPLRDLPEGVHGRDEGVGPRGQEGWTLETRGAGTAAPPPPGTARVGIAGEPVVAQLRTILEPEAKPWPTNAGLAVVGKPTPRLDGRAKVTGDAKYTADVALPGMLHAKRVVSPHPHAHVRRIDTSKAERLPGVKAVFVVNEARRARAGRSSTEKNGHVPARPLRGAVRGGRRGATTPELAEEARAAGRGGLRGAAVRSSSLDGAMQPNAPLVFPAPGRTWAAARAAAAARRKDLAADGATSRGPTQQSDGDVDAALRGQPRSRSAARSARRCRRTRRWRPTASSRTGSRTGSRSTSRRRAPRRCATSWRRCSICRRRRSA